MTLFSRCDTPPEVGRPVAARGRHDLRPNLAPRSQVFTEFFEEIGILFRYATGRDYYDRRLIVPKD